MRLRMKKVLALGLSAAMIFSLAACGNETDTAQSADENTRQEAAGEEGSGTTEDAAAESDHSETVDLTMVLVTDGTEYPGNAAVDAAVAEIAKEKLNINLSFKRANFFDYGTSMNLWLSSGEPCDLFVSLLNWNSYTQYMTDLTPYVDLMPEAMETVGDYIDMAYADGKLLGVPAMKDMTNVFSYLMRKDYVEETGIDVSTIRTYDDFEKLLRAVKENHPDVYPLVNGDLSLGVMPVSNINSAEDGTLLGTDMLVSSAGINLMDPAGSAEVSCVYTSDFYQKTCEKAYQWNQEGLIYRSDISTGAEQVRAGTAAGYSGQYKPGVEAQESAAAGTEMIVVFGPDPGLAVKQTNNFFTWSVNQNCEHPERAVELLNLMYQDEEISNLMAWGIEGTDYVHTEEYDNVIAYPEGIDASNVDYYSWAKFALPNNYLQYVMEGEDPELWEEMREFCEGAQTSLAFGFAADTAPVEGEITSVVNVISEYDKALTSGEMNPEEIDSFIADLNTAGLETIVQEIQSQLDSWLETK